MRCYCFSFLFFDCSRSITFSRPGKNPSPLGVFGHLGVYSDLDLASSSFLLRGTILVQTTPPFILVKSFWEVRILFCTIVRKHIIGCSYIMSELYFTIIHWNFLYNHFTLLITTQECSLYSNWLERILVQRSEYLVLTLDNRRSLPSFVFPHPTQFALDAYL